MHAVHFWEWRKWIKVCRQNRTFVYNSGHAWFHKSNQNTGKSYKEATDKNKQTINRWIVSVLIELGYVNACKTAPAAYWFNISILCLIRFVNLLDRPLIQKTCMYVLFVKIDFHFQSRMVETTFQCTSENEQKRTVYHT